MLTCQLNPLLPGKSGLQDSMLNLKVTPDTTDSLAKGGGRDPEVQVVASYVTTVAILGGGHVVFERNRKLQDIDRVWVAIVTGSS